MVQATAIDLPQRHPDHIAPCTRQKIDEANREAALKRVLGRRETTKGDISTTLEPKNHD